MPRPRACHSVNFTLKVNKQKLRRGWPYHAILILKAKYAALNQNTETKKLKYYFPFWLYLISQTKSLFKQRLCALCFFIETNIGVQHDSARIARPEKGAFPASWPPASLLLGQPKATRGAGSLRLLPVLHRKPTGRPAGSPRWLQRHTQFIDGLLYLWPATSPGEERE